MEARGAGEGLHRVRRTVDQTEFAVSHPVFAVGVDKSLVVGPAVADGLPARPGDDGEVLLQPVLFVREEGGAETVEMVVGVVVAGAVVDVVAVIAEVGAECELARRAENLLLIHVAR